MRGTPYKSHLLPFSSTTQITQPPRTVLETCFVNLHAICVFCGRKGGSFGGSCALLQETRARAGPSLHLNTLLPLTMPRSPLPHRPPRERSRSPGRLPYARREGDCYPLSGRDRSPPPRFDSRRDDRRGGGGYRDDRDRGGYRDDRAGGRAYARDEYRGDRRGDSRDRGRGAFRHRCSLSAARCACWVGI